MNRRRCMFVAFAFAYFLSNFARSTNAVIAPDLSREFHLSAGALGLMTSLFYLFFAAIQPPLGIALDRFGPRFVSAGLMLCAVGGSLVFASAHSYGALVGGRILIGVGMGGVLMGAYTAFSRWYSPGRFASVSGVLVGLGSLGTLATGAPLAWAASIYGWRAIFVAMAGSVFLSALSIAAVVRNSPRPVLGDGQAEQRQPTVSTEPRPSFPLRAILTDRRFLRIAFLNFAMVGPFLAMQGLWAGPYLYDVMGLSRPQVGFLLTLAGVGSLLGYFSCGFVFDRCGRRWAVILGVFAFLAAQSCLLLGTFVRLPWLAYPAYVAFGYGGAHNILTMAHARAIFPVSVIGRAVTTLNLCGVGGGAVVQAGLGALIGAFPRAMAGHYPPMAYAAALSLTLLLGASACLWYLKMR